MHPLICHTEDMARGPNRTLRQDAVVNRERLLAAASELFAQQGLSVSLNDIAHHAGVGVGTAYRRFPNKEAVIDALFEQRVEEVATVARASLDEADAWRGLVSFLEQSLSMQFGDRGLNEIMNNSALGPERVMDARDRIAPLLTALVERAKTQGTVRADFEQSDMIFIQIALSAIMDSSREVAPELYRRYLSFFLDGIRADRDPREHLPVDALDSVETHAAMTSSRRR